jgi:cytochrome c peroxidase
VKTSSFAILFFVLLTICGFNSNSGKAEQDTAHKILQSYFDDFQTFHKEIIELAKLTSEAQNHFDLESLRNQFIESRIAYKKIEFLFDYLHTSYNYLFINGGPLYKVNEDNNEIIKPNGLQTLDEIIFSDEAAEQVGDVKKLAEELKKSVDLIAENHYLIAVTDHQIIESLRSGIVRVFALGLSGFDTPGCGNAIPEALASMQSMEKAFLHFDKNTKPENRENFLKIKKIYQESVHLLASNNDFDSFDRMAYLKQVINPLYESLLDFQISNRIETEQYKYHAQNYKSRNLFDEDFLNTNVYAELSFLPLNNPATIQLGKTLFYDPIMSKNMKMSCATCHDPTKAFTDGLPKSRTNISGKFTQRNAPTLIDVGYSSRYFWDMRDYNLERQVAHVVNNSLEFNTSFGEIAERLYQSTEYTQMFEESYSKIAKKTIYRRSISNAIAAYVNSLNSFNSDFDQYVRNESAEYSEEAISGFNLFMGKAACGTCHFVPAFNGVVPPFYTETESEVLGITLGFDTIQPQKDLDPGRINNGLKKDSLPHFKNSFKTVSVRNISLTAPYMHNGLFESLEDVLEFYNLGGGAGMGLDIENQTLSDQPLNLTEKEKKDIITFLHTLTDTTGLTKVDIELPKFETRPEWNTRGQ